MKNLGVYLDTYDNLLDSMDGEDAEDLLLSDKMDPEVIKKRLLDPNYELTDDYTDDEIDAIFVLVRRGVIEDVD